MEKKKKKDHFAALSEKIIRIFCQKKKLFGERKFLRLQKNVGGWKKTEKYLPEKSSLESCCCRKKSYQRESCTWQWRLLISNQSSKKLNLCICVTKRVIFFNDIFRSEFYKTFSKMLLTLSFDCSLLPQFYGIFE